MLAKKILLTRSADENQLLHNSLSKRGFVCYSIPLIEYKNHIDLESQREKNNFDQCIRTYEIATQIQDYTNIIITSKYTAKLLLLADIPNMYQKIFWVVGKVCANILRNKGYKIKYIAENINKLIQNLPSSILQDTIYLSADQITMEMPKPVKRVITYQVKYKNHLNENEIQIIKNGINYVTLYSENSAKTLYSLLISNNLLKYMGTAILVAISDKVATVICDHFKDVIIFKNTDDIINNLYKYEQKST